MKNKKVFLFCLGSRVSLYDMVLDQAGYMEVGREYESSRQLHLLLQSPIETHHKESGTQTQLRPPGPTQGASLMGVTQTLCASISPPNKMK